MFHELTAYLSIFTLFKLYELWPYYQKHENQIVFESCNSLKLIFTNICGLCSNFYCESFLESNSPGILALNETNFDNSLDSSNF